jgi:hypothetical protein
LGIQFKQDLTLKQLWMHQQEYIKGLLNDYDLLDCNLVSTPMDSSYDLSKLDDPLSSLSEYQTLISKLLFLSICTHPNLSYTINRLAQHNSTPQLNHLAAAKCMLHYLKGTQNLGIHYEATTDRTMALLGFLDSDWANLHDRVSISGGCWFYGNCLID